MLADASPANSLLAIQQTRSGIVQKQDWLAERFEENRGHLRGVAYRMLGSLSEAEDAVQEAWLRLSRSTTDSIENLGGWLTTVVSRVCLDMLRSRKARREESMEATPAATAAATSSSDPESEAALADSVGLALMVVLERLAPAERMAFVLHDMFGISFDEIGNILGKSSTAARQLASRARRRVHGGGETSPVAKTRHRELVEKLLEALRARDVQAIVAVLDPQFVFRVDDASIQPGGEREVHGAEFWASRAVRYAAGVPFTRVALVDGEPAFVMAPQGHLVRVVKFAFGDNGITAGEVIGDRARLEEMELSVLE
jgi:RNA polymerase sigma-70 factor (ECF subfamily)